MPNAPSRVVFLTGASSGIGEALAHHYAAEGAALGLYARRPEALDRLASSLPGARVMTFAGDVRDHETLARSATAFMAAFGVPDIVIGNAGISQGTLTAHAEDLPAFRAVMDTNYMGLVHTFQPFVARMLEAGRGTLCGVASVAGFRGIPGSGAYSGSKAAAIAYLEALRIELRGSGVDVVTVCPGWVATPLTAKNPYRMPFLMTPVAAARGIASAIDRRKRLHVLPWPMAIVARILRVLPGFVFDRALATKQRKPRQASSP